MLRSPAQLPGTPRRPRESSSPRRLDANNDGPPQQCSRRPEPGSHPKPDEQLLPQAALLVAHACAKMEQRGDTGPEARRCPHAAARMISAAKQAPNMSAESGTLPSECCFAARIHGCPWRRHPAAAAHHGSITAAGSNARDGQYTAGRGRSTRPVPKWIHTHTHNCCAWRGRRKAAVESIHTLPRLHGAALPFADHRPLYIKAGVRLCANTLSRWPGGHGRSRPRVFIFALGLCSSRRGA